MQLDCDVCAADFRLYYQPRQASGISTIGPSNVRDLYFRHPSIPSLINSHATDPRCFPQTWDSRPTRQYTEGSQVRGPSSGRNLDNYIVRDHYGGRAALAAVPVAHERAGISRAAADHQRGRAALLGDDQ